MNEDLSLVSTDHLMTAVLHRFDHAVVVGLLTTSEKRGEHKYVRRWRGNSHTCAGLCFDVAGVIIADCGVMREGESDGK